MSQVKNEVLSAITMEAELLYTLLMIALLSFHETCPYNGR